MWLTITLKGTTTNHSLPDYGSTLVSLLSVCFHNGSSASWNSCFHSFTVNKHFYSKESPSFVSIALLRAGLQTLLQFIVVTSWHAWCPGRPNSRPNMAARTWLPIETQHKRVNVPSNSSHKYFNYLSTEEKQRYEIKLWAFSTCDPYTTQHTAII